MWVCGLLLVAAVAAGDDSRREVDLLLEWDGRTVPVISYQKIESSCSKWLSDSHLSEQLRAELLLRHADATYFLYDYEKSARSAEQAVRIEPDDFEARWRLARAWLNVPDREDEAAAIGKQLMADQPDRAEGYYILGCGRLMSGQFAAAVRYLDKAVERAPRNPKIFYARTYAHSLSDNVGRCLQDLDLALTLPPASSPTRGEIHALYGRALFREGRFEEAAPFLAAALRSPRTAEQALPRLWYCQAELGNFGACLTLSTTLVHKYPQLCHSHWMYARTLAELGDLDEADRVARRAVEIGPDKDDAWSSLIAVCLERGEFAEALNAFERGGKRTIDGAVRTAFLLATCPVDRIRNGPVAKTGATKCIECLASAKARQVAMIVLALAEAECGERKAAIQTLSKALELGRANPEIVAACQELTTLFLEDKAYRYDPRSHDPAAFRLHPATVVVH